MRSASAASKVPLAAKWALKEAKWQNPHLCGPRIGPHKGDFGQKFSYGDVWRKLGVVLRGGFWGAHWTVAERLSPAARAESAISDASCSPGTLHGHPPSLCLRMGPKLEGLTTDILRVHFWRHLEAPATGLRPRLETIDHRERESVAKMGHSPCMKEDGGCAFFHSVLPSACCSPDYIPGIKRKRFEPLERGD